jgi:hypothetical protein
MRWWEYDLFKKGAGCPACKGDVGQHENMDNLENHLRDVVMNSEDPDSFPRLHDPETRPHWAGPPTLGKVLWVCHGCQTVVRISNDAPYDGKEVSKNDVWLEWFTGDTVHYYSGCGPFAFPDLMRPNKYDDEPTRTSELIINEKPYCPGCAGLCRECGEAIFTREQPDDSNDPGASFSHPHNPFLGSVCLTCLNKLEEPEPDCD